MQTWAKKVKRVQVQNRYEKDDEWSRMRYSTREDTACLFQESVAAMMRSGSRLHILPECMLSLEFNSNFKLDVTFHYIHKLSSIFIMCHSNSRLCKMTWDSSTSINLHYPFREHALLSAVNAGLKSTT